MNNQFTLLNKILIISSILLYLIGFFLIGGWNIFFNLFYLYFLINIIKKIKEKNQITKYLLFITIFLFLNVLIKIGFFYNLYLKYSLISNKKLKTVNSNNSSIEKPTPTIYQCPVINQKNKEDIEAEKAENNLSSYNYQENIPGSKPNEFLKRIITENFLEKKLLPCQYYDENYCYIKNNNLWIIKYPKNWQLYRIKRQVLDNYSEDRLIFYDLKFENGSSYFYLEEIITVGGNPGIINREQWDYLKKYCQNMFYTNDNFDENYICYGNVLGCSGNMKGYFDKNYSINSYYKSFIQINSKIQKDEVLIYNWYIPSIKYENDNKIGLRAYIFSKNFYSNDEKFISELKKIYVSILKNELFADNFTENFIKKIKEPPKQWERAVKFKTNKITDDLNQLCVIYPQEKNQNKNNYCDFIEYWTNNRSENWEFLDRFYSGQEGPTTCEIYEKWKVAKGLSCYRLSTGETSQVSY